MKKLNQKGFIYEAMALLGLALLFIGFMFTLCCINIKLSNEVVSGIVYNTSYDTFIGGNTRFSIRAGENTPITSENESSYCLPQKSKYEAIVRRAAEDKRIKVVVTANKYGINLALPWTCINNVTVTEVK